MKTATQRERKSKRNIHANSIDGTIQLSNLKNLDEQLDKKILPES
jgi:hypothetical protein